jgi:hypothetical protein
VGFILVRISREQRHSVLNALCSRNSGGGGRPLASIFEAEGAERAKIGSGTEKEAHFSEDDSEHRDGTKAVPIVIMSVLVGYAR